MSCKKVLIAHQSTIPHYRAAFYEELNKVKSNNWQFTVVYDSKISNMKNFKNINIDKISYPILFTNTKIFYMFRKHILLQDFIFYLKNFDIIIIENALNNISYPLCFLNKKEIILWGHGKDFSVVNPSLLKKAIERFKLFLCKKSNGFFAYTKGVKKILMNNNIEEKNITVLNNTIDILSNRKKYLSIKNKMQNNKRISHHTLLFVGRLNKRKRLEYLLDAFILLRTINPNYELNIVGSGSKHYENYLKKKYNDKFIKFFGEITDGNKLVSLYLKSDLFVFPGDIGLGPLHALSFNLIPIVIESESHNPEREYLNDINSFILPKSTTEQEFANEINRICIDNNIIKKKEESSWDTIKNLTLKNMANNFANGVEKIL